VNTPERELARISHADIGDIYNGMIGLQVTFEYEGCGAQGLGSYTLDAAFVIRFLQAVGVDALSKAKGKSVWVIHTYDRVLAIEPLHKKDGKPFVIAEWSEWLKRRCSPLSYHELATGEDPNLRRPASSPEGK
jgi:hypothetical protein